VNLFDEVFATTRRCADHFQDGVRDPFGASIVIDVLEPIIREVDSLRSASAEFQRNARQVDQLLVDARVIQPSDKEQAT
jgi:hypothetical protein